MIKWIGKYLIEVDVFSIEPVEPPPVKVNKFVISPLTVFGEQIKDAVVELIHNYSICLGLKK